MSTDTRHSLNGPTMGTRWTAVIVADAAFDSAALAADLAAAVACVDEQMSTWKPSSDLMRLNRAALGEWQAMPPQIMAVLAAAEGMANASEGLFDISVGDLVRRWAGSTPRGSRQASARRVLGRLSRWICPKAKPDGCRMSNLIFPALQRDTP